MSVSLKASHPPLRAICGATLVHGAGSTVCIDSESLKTTDWVKFEMRCEVLTGPGEVPGEVLGEVSVKLW